MKLKLRRETKGCLSTISLIAALITTADAEVTLPSVFGDHMILQRDLATPVWGWADSGEAVAVEFRGQSKQTTADDKGRWSVRLDPVPASREPNELVVKGANEIAFQDVLVGDVYVCSGQSNMEWSVKGSLNADSEIAAANFPKIRLFDVPGHNISPYAREKLKQPGKWLSCSPKTIGGFSAVGYYFGRKLHRESEVPIGLVGTNWGGTRIEPWTPRVGFAGVPELGSIAKDIAKSDVTTDVGKQNWDEYVTAVEKWVGQARDRIAVGEPPAELAAPPGVKHHGEGTAIYNAMVHPLIPYGIRGVIWYQGESNGGEGLSYYHKMKALILGWRELWGQSDFPIYFYWVQLADFQEPNDNPAGGDGWAKLREAQRKALEIPHTGMAVITDVGNANDIHPRNKQDVGARLANWALRDVYEKAVVPSGPLYRDAVIEGEKIRVHFDHVGGGLMVGKRKDGLNPTPEDTEGSLRCFAIAGTDKVWHWADAKIDGECVVVSSPNVESPVAVRYAYTMNPAGANLYNREGLPASPFRSDDW